MRESGQVRECSLCGYKTDERYFVTAIHPHNCRYHYPTTNSIECPSCGLQTEEYFQLTAPMELNLMQESMA